VQLQTARPPGFQEGNRAAEQLVIVDQLGQAQGEAAAHHEGPGEFRGGTSDGARPVDELGKGIPLDPFPCSRPNACSCAVRRA
jgi:hypothetical protein